MKLTCLLLVALAGVPSGKGQNASAGANGTGSASAGNPSQAVSAAAQTGTLVQAELTKGIDAKKAKTGDPVLAKTTQEFQAKEDVKIPKNTKLFGHVVQVQAKGKGQGESLLAVAFDKAQLKDGREVSLSAMIQAISPPPSISAPDMDGGGDVGSQPKRAPMGSSPGGGGVGVATVNSAAGATARTAGDVTSGAANVAGAVGATAENTQVANGVVGIKGLQLDTTASSSENGSVFRSTSDNVRLESGTRLVLRVTVQ